MNGIEPLAAIRLSLVVALWCTVIGLPIAIAIGWVLARKRFLGKTVVTAIVMAPMVLPPVVTGLLLLGAFGKRGIFGPVLAAVGVHVPFSVAGAVIAAAVVGLPLFVMSTRAAFESIDPAYEELSATLGDAPWRTFVRVTLPLAVPGIAGGAVLAFARSLGEFGATIVLAGNTDDTRTISIAIYSLLDRPGAHPEVLGLSGASIAISLAALVGYELLIRRQRDRLELDRGR
ncbi:MAG TPA: molybdate ABC transporter permease subunit [Nannocystaceae bacterium]|nr:molybdate ABC transporter permease subunit [Nannocystaceae bacterium]